MAAPSISFFSEAIHQHTRKKLGFIFKWAIYCRILSHRLFDDLSMDTDWRSPFINLLEEVLLRKNGFLVKRAHLRWPTISLSLSSIFLKVLCTNYVWARFPINLLRKAVHNYRRKKNGLCFPLDNLQ